MTDPYAHQGDDSADATIPLVPDAGYAATEPVPFAEETLVDPVGTSPWSAAAADSLSAPGYSSTGASYASLDSSYEGTDDEDTTASAPTGQAPQSGASGYGQTGYGQAPYGQQAYGQSGYGQAPLTNGPQPPAATTNYVQPQAFPAVQPFSAPQPFGQQTAPQQAAAPQAGFAEPSGPAASIGAQNIYQGYPTAGYGQQQQPAWPAVVPDPVGYDYGYGRQPAASDHPNAMTSLVLGIVGLAFFQVLSPVAWFMAAKGRREMAAYPGRWRNSGTLTAGLVLGIIGTVLLGLFAAGMLLFVLAMVSSVGG